MIYPGLYHEIFNESEPGRSRVIADLRNWLLARMDELPASKAEPAAEAVSV
jgi:alpha-beta hydrolase superfamily lysophospholipase